LFERRAGGRVYEAWGDGTTVGWSDVLTWSRRGAS
jgi:hypothetical protein